VNACVGETVNTLAKACQLVCSTAAPQTKPTDTFITDAALARPPQVYKPLLRLKQCPVMAARDGLLTREPQTWHSRLTRFMSFGRIRMSGSREQLPQCLTKQTPLVWGESGERSQPGII